MNLARGLVIVVVIELTFVVATRVVLHYFSWDSVEAESIRTALRILTATVYWWLLKPLILSRRPDLTVLLRPSALAGLLLFLSIPLFVGRYGLSSHVAIMFALTSIAVAVKEEFLFRGIIQNLLGKKVSAVNAILLTSAVFTLWHVGTWAPTIWTFSQIFVASILLGLIYIRSGSITAVIVIHTLYDALFSFSPLVPKPLDENWGFVPLLSAVGFVIYWAFSGNGLTLRSTGRATGSAPVS